MAIQGLRRTALQTYAMPGKAPGPFITFLDLPLEFVLQLGGPSTAIFENESIYLSCQKNDVAVRLQIQVTDQNGTPVPLGAATLLSIKLRYPDGSARDFVQASLLNNGDDGRLYYRTIDGDLDQVGLYFIQAKISFGSDPKSTRLGQFQVYDNVDDN